MKTPSYVSQFLAVLIILGFVQATSCRYLDPAASKEIDQRLKDKYSAVFLSSLSAIRSHGKPVTEPITSFHAVSRRLVPGGPNPLHN
ncbi:Detected protein of unknown function [Hibiscus syriacus]|uniref:Uncharacterized protein n=1 Tax=Hibiscus syriacus TaxID=106335 RepID=A0A6A3C570_HIBSY|nr:Detected protein of unknown function [Hibiscus syriacus]KAE8722179.1 Detected protein of unknown function [Hibiscus syriacus]